jgi:hypothetical protein
VATTRSLTVVERVKLAHALADYMRRRSPLVFCLVCIAATFEIDQRALSTVLRQLLAQPGFRKSRGVCCGCVRSEDVIEWTDEHRKSLPELRPKTA